MVFLAFHHCDLGSNPTQCYQVKLVCYGWQSAINRGGGLCLGIARYPSQIYFLCQEITLLFQYEGLVFPVSPQKVAPTLRGLLALW